MMASNVTAKADKKIFQLSCITRTTEEHSNSFPADDDDGDVVEDKDLF